MYYLFSMKHHLFVLVWRYYNDYFIILCCSVLSLNKYVCLETKEDDYIPLGYVMLERSKHSYILYYKMPISPQFILKCQLLILIILFTNWSNTHHILCKVVTIINRNKWENRSFLPLLYVSLDAINTCIILHHQYVRAT